MPMFHDPNSAVVALVIGLLGVIFEFHSPGAILPGVGGAALVLLSCAALSHYPVSPGAVTLIAVSILALALELKVSSHGVLAGLGAILLACGMYLLIDSPAASDRIRPATAFGLVLPFGLLTAFLLTIASRARQSKWALGASALIGKTGSVVDAPGSLRVQIAGEYWSAKSSATLTPGTAVRVTAIQGLELAVIPLHDTMVNI